MADVRYIQATKLYSGTEVPAVEALDLHIEDGELMVLVGPSGSGKTTALVNSGLSFPLADKLGKDPVRGVGGTCIPNPYYEWARYYRGRPYGY